MQILIPYFKKHHLDLYFSEKLPEHPSETFLCVSVTAALTASHGAALAPLLVHLLLEMLVFLWAELRVTHLCST